MKKLFAALLAVLMVFGCVPCITAAETANTLDEFDTALNAAGGSLDFTNDETNPWLFCADADGSENGAVRSNIASMNDTETMFTFTASVQAGERLRFDLKLSTEDEYDTFRLYDNGYPVMYRCGSTDWYTEVYTITESGEHTFSFAYSKDASGEDGEDTVFVDNVAVLATDPNALSLNAVLNAEGCNHEYVTERSEWIPAVYNERECAKSNIEYQNDGVATLYTECYLEAGAGITFEYAASSEEDFDNLYFSAINLDNGTEYEHELTMTGDVDWTNAAWGVPETGNYRLIFTYEKDGGGYSGADSVYVTNVFVPNAAVGEVKWSTSFEDENPLLCGWTTIDADGDGLAFAWTRDLEHFLYADPFPMTARQIWRAHPMTKVLQCPATPMNTLFPPQQRLVRTTQASPLRLPHADRTRTKHVRNISRFLSAKVQRTSRMRMLCMKARPFTIGCSMLPISPLISAERFISQSAISIRRICII